jgi:hypothetical protein
LFNAAGEVVMDRYIDLKHPEEFFCHEIANRSIAGGDIAYKTFPSEGFDACANRCLGEGTVRFFRQGFTLEDTIGSHACSGEVSMRVTNGIPLGCPLFLPVGTCNLRLNTEGEKCRVG